MEKLHTVIGLCMSCVDFTSSKIDPLSPRRYIALCCTGILRMRVRCRRPLHPPAERPKHARSRCPEDESFSGQLCRAGGGDSRGRLCHRVCGGLPGQGRGEEGGARPPLCRGERSDRL